MCVCARARARACVSGATINAEEGNRGERERPEKETGGRVHRESPGSDCFAEGQRVLAWHKKGCWDPATIARHWLGNEKFRVAWADCAASFVRRSHHLIHKSNCISSSNVCPSLHTVTPPDREEE